jgi:pimeloyl-ACP methyl ester carboxylesterase
MTRLAIGVLLAALLPIGGASTKSALAATRTAAAAPAAEVEPLPQGRVYLFRGALGPIFSTGIDRLAERLTHAGLKADVYEFTLCRLVAQRAIANYRDAPAPIILIGHSMGGLCALVFADMMGKENIPVSLVVTIDPAHASPNVPLNVERFINIFLSDSVLGGGDIVAEPGYRGHYASFDLKQHKEISHVNIEKADDIQAQLVDMVTQLPLVPRTEGDAVPLRYLVPPDSKVELWDSGIRLPARRGDTLEHVATLYRVPMWSLLQANQLPENAPLAAGQQIVIPRHLVPAAMMAPAAAAAPAR